MQQMTLVVFTIYQQESLKYVSRRKNYWQIWNFENVLNQFIPNKYFFEISVIFAINRNGDAFNFLNILKRLKW